MRSIGMGGSLIITWKVVRDHSLFWFVMHYHNHDLSSLVYLNTLHPQNQTSMIRAYEVYLHS